LIQERLPAEGQGIGVCLLLDRSHLVRAGFVHRRLREYPVTGGPSTLRESCNHEQAYTDAVRLLQDLRFVGVAMVEFKNDTRTGKANLLEVNPRFWGSLALAVDAGVNFPLLWTLMALGEDVAPVTSYRLGHRCRWLLPGDILHFIHNPNRWQLEPSFFRFRASHQTYDIIDARDPLPILGTMLSLLPYFVSADFAHVRGRRSRL
jgi:predicted ATP-grasp superfamily ATP-dependent carboligase